MGIRPSMYLLAGINDLKVEKYDIVDSRYKGNNDRWWKVLEECPPLPKEPDNVDVNDEVAFKQAMRAGTIRSALLERSSDGTEYQRPGYDLIHWDAEYGLGNIIGHVVHQLPYDDTMFYALASLYYEFENNGYRVLPSLPVEQDSSLGAQAIKLAQRLVKRGDSLEHLSQEARAAMRIKQELIKNEWNYPLFSWRVESYMQVAHYLLTWAGLDVQESDLKLMLYWQWS